MAQRFQEFFAAQTVDHMQLGQVLQDGGQLAGGVLEFADDATWKQFNEMFLRPQDQERTPEKFRTLDSHRDGPGRRRMP